MKKCLIAIFDKKVSQNAVKWDIMLGNGGAVGRMVKKGRNNSQDEVGMIKLHDGGWYDKTA
ncbi:MAG: hypothetical protein LBR77_05760 [Lachnospiraceae bacterium]|nr:hypothetical protein [Lachnospiraceae bacterium]